jgi:hypothetical protein
MCCFSRSVTFVRNTRIFARMLDAGMQGLAYQMALGAPEDLAMILPLPVKPATPEKGVKFLDLSGYPKFFDDLAAGFPAPETDSPFAGSLGVSPRAKSLEVQKVGAFEASFVPTVKDFSRLDARFRLPEGVWDKLGQYADHGFAVFKLRKGETKIHPMAFAFPSRHEDRLFFPTVHIHDGEVHPKADFDHTLYCQIRRGGRFALLKWAESERAAVTFTKAGLSKGLIEPAWHVHKLDLHGELANEDTFLRAV